MVDELRLSEAVRELLVLLYEPTVLATTPLAAELIRRGRWTGGTAVAEALLGAIDELRPLDPAPQQSHGWRCYRYLQLRYVECQSHASIARDLGISLRQASRVHHDALRMLTRTLLPDAGRGVATAADLASAKTCGDGGPARSDRRPGLNPSRDVLESELATVGSLHPESGVHLTEVVRSVEETFQRFAAAYAVELASQLPPDLPPVQANRIALRQILLNVLLHLVEGARGHQPAENLAISLRGEPADGTIMLVVRCETRGIPPDADRPNGAEAPPPDHDARFPNESPFQAARYLAEGQRVSIEGGGGDRLPLEIRIRVPIGAPTVLLVDDNPDVGSLFRRMLARSAYELVQIRNPSRAVTSARENPPDAIILDIVMPSRDGWEILTTLKGDRRTAATPVIVCSVLPDRGLALSLGASDFLPKPVSRQALLDALERVLRPAVQRVPEMT